MGNTYTRQSATAIATGNVITAADLEAEFDEVVAAFNSSTGHAHDGTDSPRISTIGPAGEYTSTATEFKPTSTGLDLGSSASQWDNAYIDGTAYIDTGKFGTSEYTTITDNEYDVSSGNLTVDVAGNIVLDTDGGNVTLQDAGVTFANLNNATGELVIQSGATPTTAVTFSGANADFAGTLDVTGAVTLDSTLNVTGAITGDLTGNLTGNADTATALASSVTIGGVSFDGSTNIDLPGVNTSGTQDTSGNAATSSAWAAGIEISLTGDVTGSVTGVDGSGNVSIETTVSADATELGTDTTGNYVASITNGTYITGGDGGTESAALTIDVDATDANTASKIVARDSSGNFSAGTITADLSGDVTSTGTSTFNKINTGQFHDLTLDSEFGYSRITVEPASPTLTNSAGYGLKLTSGKSTGTALPGGFIFYSSLIGDVSGNTLNTTAEYARLYHQYTVNKAMFQVRGDIELTTGLTDSSPNFRIRFDSNDDVQVGTTSRSTWLSHGTSGGIAIGNTSNAGDRAVMTYSNTTNMLTFKVAAGGSSNAGYGLGNPLAIAQASSLEEGVYANVLYNEVLTDTAGADVTIQLGEVSYANITLDQSYAQITLQRSTLTSWSSTPFDGAGQRLIVRVAQDGTGGHTNLIWSTVGSTTIVWEGGSAPTQTTTAGKSDIYEFISFGGTELYGRRIGANF